MIAYTPHRPHVVSKVNRLFYSPFFCYTVGGSGNGSVGSIDGCCIGGRGWWMVGGGVSGGRWEVGGGSSNNHGGRQRQSTTMGSVVQCWMGEDGGSRHLGVAVAAMAAAAAAGGGIFYAL
jgi:hypothetical protein